MWWKYSAGQHAIILKNIYYKLALIQLVGKWYQLVNNRSSGIKIERYDLRTGSANRLNKNGWTSSSVSGPPRFNKSTPIFSSATLEDTPLASSTVVTTFAELDLTRRFRCFTGLVLAKQEDPFADNFHGLTSCLVEQVKLVEVVLPYDLPIIATINQHWKCIFGFQQDRSQNLKKKSHSVYPSTLAISCKCSLSSFLTDIEINDVEG